MLPISSSLCTASSLRVFIRTFIGTEVPCAERLRLPTPISNFRRPFHSSPFFHLKQSRPALESRQLSTVVFLASLDDNFVPFDRSDGSGVAHTRGRPGNIHDQQLCGVPQNIIDPDFPTAALVEGVEDAAPQIVLHDGEIACIGSAEGDTASEVLLGLPEPRDPQIRNNNRREKERAREPFKRGSDVKRLLQSPQAKPLTRSHDSKQEPWQVQKDALLKKFGSSGWTPRKRLSPDALEGIRALHAQYPEKYTTPELAKHFEVSPENIRRILKSKWRPNEEEEGNRRQRWIKRGESKWSQMAELGIKPPKKWRRKGIGKDQLYYHEREGHKSGKETGIQESLSAPVDGFSERRLKPSLSEMIL